MATRNSKRTLVKRITSLNLYVDQAVQIKALMEATGSTKEAPLVRQLVDEALAARRRKSIPREESEQVPPTQSAAETLQTIQTLLLKLIRQADTAIRAEGISLILLQEILAEASGSRTILWNRLESAALTEAGLKSSEIAQRFKSATLEAKEYAYCVADEIRNLQETQADQRTHECPPDQLPLDYDRS
jgi:hypothetical protein